MYRTIHWYVAHTLYEKLPLYSLLNQQQCFIDAQTNFRIRGTTSTYKIYLPSNTLLREVACISGVLNSMILIHLIDLSEIPKIDIY